MKMVILGSIPPIFDRITSAWDSSHLPERTLIALTSRLLIEELRTLVKYSGGKHPDNVAFFAEVLLRSKVTRLKAVSVVEEEIIVIAETSVEDPTEATTKDVKVVSTTIQIRLRKTGDATTTISQTT